MPGQIVVADGISGDRSWATYTRKASGALQRVKSPALPLCATREEAELDLFCWLSRREIVGGLTVDEGRCLSELRASLLARLRGEGGR